MEQILESYRISCNQLTMRIFELSEQIKQTQMQAEREQLEHRKQLLQRERLELLQVMEMMMPYIEAR